MAIGNWHGGKVALVWLVAAVVGFLGVVGALVLVDELDAAVWVGYALVFGVPAVALGAAISVTWRWLPGKEKEA